VAAVKGRCPRPLDDGDAARTLMRRASVRERRNTLVGGGLFRQVESGGDAPGRKKSNAPRSFAGRGSGAPPQRRGCAQHRKMTGPPATPTAESGDRAAVLL